MSSSIEERLPLIWPRSPQGLAAAPLPVLWEVTRVALECEVDIASLDMQYEQTWTDQEILWAVLKSHRSFKRRRLPPKSDPRAWRLALDNNFELDGEAVVLTVTMHLNHSKVGPPMRLELHPLKREQSSRLFRKFGSDRFLEVRVPAVDSWQPSSFPTPTSTPSAHGEDEIEAIAARWLTRADHWLVGRRWSGFYVRDRPLKVETSTDQRGMERKTVFYDRIMLFAEEGKDLCMPQPPRTERRVGRATTVVDRKTACSRNMMLDWLLNFEQQGGESYLKLFHRVALGLSQTAPVFVLEERQIRHKSQDLVSAQGEVMNDGAARISPTLMKKVRDFMGLQTIPTAIQGRLGSSKGMWMVDPTDTGHEDWIETYPKQRKWKCDESEEAHRTLEVRSWSSELSAASLNIQFLPILEDRAPAPKAMRATFVRNMITESENEIQELKQVLQYAELFRKWACDSAQTGAQRLLNRAVPFLGGLPDGFEDIMNFLVDGGFEPMKLKFLQELVFTKQRTKGDKMTQELKIKIAKSTYAYMLVDFWDVLEPDEVHLSFSARFSDGTDELSDLDGINVLVGRSPAHLPSDIQKVKAVFRPELRHLRDVIIFSARGDYPLAALLSGGDYDGDKAWVCWDQEIVDNFRNHPLPTQPDFSPYLKKDKTTLGDLRNKIGSGKYIDDMIEKAFCFNLRPKLLGYCTSYKEKLCYNICPVSSKTAIAVSWLLSELADQPKQGVLFAQDDWKRFRNTTVRNRRELSTPAYKTGGLRSRPEETQHVIDYLMCKAEQVVNGALTDLNQFLKSSGASTWDQDVTEHWNTFELAHGDISMNGRPRCKWFLALRDGLKADVDACLREWNGLMEPGVMDYREKVGHAYVRWRAIKPHLPESRESNSAVSMVKTWLGADLPNARDLCPWELLKASWAFKHYHQKRFVWQMAGRQLQAIKSLSARSSGAQCPIGDGSAVPVVANMYAALKPDNTYIKRLVALEADDDDDFVGEIGHEAAGMETLSWRDEGC
ncbi:unnamed protein product [Discula destructiva]